ncbi:MAG: hypothetical protein U1E23_07170 [Reyranellaceae bacterium]
MKRVISMAMLAALWCGGPALAQTAPIEFRVTPVQGNPGGCMRFDPALSRVHTISLQGDKAVLKSSGGINDTLKQASPNVYTTRYRMGEVTLDVTADASRTPRSLTVVEPKLGCRWTAIAA